jgi:hypothetical protein
VSAYFFLLLIVVALCNGCTSTVYENIKSEPEGADVYVGETPDAFRKTDFKTPYSRKISASKIAPYCFQLKKDGYRDSEVFCRAYEQSWLVNVKMKPIRTTITSAPPGAEIFWGTSEKNVRKTVHKTPYTASGETDGVSWKDWYFQVKKAGYKDTDILFQPRAETDRTVHFVLEPLQRQAVPEKDVVSGNGQEPGRSDTAGKDTGGESGGKNASDVGGTPK